jgi:hypothetical protein
MDAEQKLCFPFCVFVVGTSKCLTFIYICATVLAQLAIILTVFSCWQCRFDVMAESWFVSRGNVMCCNRGTEIRELQVNCQLFVMTPRQLYYWSLSVIVQTLIPGVYH